MGLAIGTALRLFSKRLALPVQLQPYGQVILDFRFGPLDRLLLPPHCLLEIAQLCILCRKCIENERVVVPHKFNGTLNNQIVFVFAAQLAMIKMADRHKQDRNFLQRIMLCR